MAAILWIFGGSDLTFNYWHHVASAWSTSTAPMVDEKMINPGH
jgi:hypothetical protein